MADPGDESPENQGFERRRGWEPPSGSDLPSGLDPPRSAGSEPADAVSQRPGPPEGDRPRSVLANSVAGQARDVAVGSMSISGGSLAVVTFRLEQYDPHAGRTGLVTARLLGDTAMGFATEGDWVEVNGKHEGGFINVQAAFNHTSGAQFTRKTGCMVVGAGMVIVVLSGILFILMVANLGFTSFFSGLSAWIR
jgi:hypothetical protein